MDRIELAKSNRSRCTTCGVAIDQGDLRFGATVVEEPRRRRLASPRVRAGRDAGAARAGARRRRTCRRSGSAAAARCGARPARPRSSARRRGGRAVTRAGAAIATGAMRVVIEARSRSREPDVRAQRGYIHLGCAPAFTGGAGGVQDYLAKRATGLAKADRASVPNLFGAARLVATDAARRRNSRRRARYDVLADWLEEEHGIVLAAPGHRAGAGRRARAAASREVREVREEAEARDPSAVMPARAWRDRICRRGRAVLW